ncbi:MAG: c-type cytochrome [Verrucomicrobiaceae bacterium]|nr:c-type cytochrome [Verrucomicrobiaceae bacterium]
MHRIAFMLLPLAALAQSGPPPKAPDVPVDLPPRVEILQPGVKLTMLAEHPDLVTPTGIDVDEKGNIWSISCHTHFRPEGYDGPQYDEVVVFDANGKNRRVFYTQTKSTMHVECGPDGWIYLSERGRVLRVKDTNGDGVGDKEETLLALDTVSDYPHNGLSGMAWAPDGSLVFSLGENFGKDWTLTAKDGTKVSGRGEGGVFRCTADGKKLHRIAKGFWNPFGICVRSDGEIFAADNDPGSRPPCRLLNVVEGADYGFQWVYGSAPVHPFVAWNGELRGTLGMIHPSGEGPCAVVELGGGVLIPSWSDHSVDYFPLHRKGAGYTSERIKLLKGSDFFRPTCMVSAGKGVFYFNDWVFSSYPIHKRGRLWKLEISDDAAWIKKDNDPLTKEAELARDLRDGKAKLDTAKLLTLARGTDAVLSDAALTALARESWTVDKVKSLPKEDRVWAFVALRRNDMSDEQWPRAFLNDADPELRFESLRWIADAVLKSFTMPVEAMLSDASLDYRLFEAALATWNTLRGDPGAGVTNPEVLVERITNPKTPARLKGYALRLTPPTHKALTLDMLREFANSSDDVLQLEAVRTLAARPSKEAHALLFEIVRDDTRPVRVRADAIAGLNTSDDKDYMAYLVRLSATSSEPSLRSEALRVYRHSSFAPPPEPAPQRPPFDQTEAWLKLIDSLPGKADPEAGRRLFFNTKVATCASCHRHSGRGNVVGPDLTLVAQQGDRLAILRSILEPSREVAPQFYPSQVKLKDGTDFIGILLRSSSTEVFRDLTGKEKSFPQTDIVSRVELKTSLMPPGLVMTMTDEELRDLLAFLASGAK